MKRITLLLTTLALLAACTTAPQTPAQAVYALQGSYATALTIAVKYRQLPACGQPQSPVLCADAGVVAKLQEADNVAYPALQGAQNVVRIQGAGANAQTAIATAEAAVNAFVSITTALGVK